MIGIRLLGLAAGGKSPYDGQWLVEYDPTRQGVHPTRGHRTLAHLVCTSDPGRARRFGSAAEAHAVWTAPSGRPYPLDRPLTAFHIKVEELP